MRSIELQRVYEAVLTSSVVESRKALSAAQAPLRSLEAIQRMRESAQMIKDLYAQYPHLDGVTLGIYYCGPDELDFYLSDVVADGQDDSDLESELVDVMSNFIGDSPISGVLNSDGDMLKFYEHMTQVDPKTEGRLLETTRSRVERALQSEDPNALAAELFLAAWEEHASRLTQGRSSNRKLTIFADTTDSGPMVRVDIDEKWIARAEDLARFSRENNVFLSMPIQLSLAHDDVESFEHEAQIYPRADGADTVEFSFYLSGNPQITICTPLIGLNELRQTIELGHTVHCVDFGLELLDVDTALAEFGLSFADDGSLVKASAGHPRPKG